MVDIEQDKKVSIIIPFYNTKEFIDDCLNSVMNQSYSNIEIIIINDCSDKEDSDYLESLLKGKDVVYLKNDIHKGVAYSRNKGINASTGDYIYFLDSDDIIAHDTIQLLVENIGFYPVIAGKSKRLIRPSDLQSIIRDEEDKKVVKVKKINKKYLVYSKSILNLLIKKELFEKNNVRFSEETKHYTDLSGIFPLILEIDRLPRLQKITYLKRMRNDPITNPSLQQMSIHERTKDFISVLLTLYYQYKENKILTNYLQTLLLVFYRKNLFRIFNSQEHFKEFFKQFNTVLKIINNEKNKKQPFHVKLELKYLKQGNEKKFRRIFRFHKEYTELRDALGGFTRLKRYIYKKFFIRFPLKNNYIIFESFLGKNYADSPRNIYEYIIEHYPQYKCVWVFNEKRKDIPGNPKVVKRFSLAYFYYFAVSKYWVNNMRQPLSLIKRDGNVFLQTWHGTPLKKLVFDMKEVYSANPKYKANFYKQSRAWDYLISPNMKSSEIFRRAFKFDKNLLEYGYPRNDILYSPEKELIADKVRRSLGIPKDKKIILYAPTWRDDEFYAPGKYKFNIKLDLHKMKEKLGDEYVVALRMHYFIADDINTEGLEGFAFNLSKYDDIAELYLIADILITDYSSVFFDYANLKRPILFYMYDLEKYRDELRGFYLDVENEAPGPILRTSEEVIKAIMNIEEIQKEFAPKYEEFYKQFCSWHDGKATKKIVEAVFQEKN